MFFFRYTHLVIPSFVAKRWTSQRQENILHLGLESFFSFLLNYDHATLGERLNWVRLFTLWVGGLFKQLLPSSLCGGSAGGSFRVSLMDAAKAGSLKTTGRGSHDRRRTGRGGKKEKQEERAIPPTPRPGRRAERNAA